MRMKYTGTAEVCLKPLQSSSRSGVGPVETNEQRQLNLTMALSVYLTSIHTELIPNTCLSLSDITYFNDFPLSMIDKLLDNCGNSAEMDLTKAELLIASQISKVYVGGIYPQVEYVEQNQFVSLKSVLDSLMHLELDHELPKDKASMLEDGGDNYAWDKDEETMTLSNTEIQFIYYENVDTIAYNRVLDDHSSDPSFVSNAMFDDFVSLGSTSFNSSSLNKHERIHQLNQLFPSKEDQDYINDSLSFHSTPNSKFDDLWESLKLDKSLKTRIFNQLSNSITYRTESQSNLFIFHGPPGSGKSTLCKAIAQRLSISHQFNSQQQCSSLVLQISCEKIFSKWYGESSQNLIKLFQIITKTIEFYSKSLVILIIDEVETLANSRSQILAKNETSDGIRIVNTFLTQLDLLKPFSNFMVLATSNLINSIDEAFLDRADGCFFIDRPNVEAKYEILKTEIIELKHKGLLEWDDDICLEKIPGSSSNSAGIIPKILYQLCLICDSNLKMSGRSMKKLPHLAISRVLAANHKSPKIQLNTFLKSLSRSVLEMVSSE